MRARGSRALAAIADSGGGRAPGPRSQGQRIFLPVNLTSPAEVSSLLRRYGLHPRKRWGQNFLIDRNTLNNVLRAADVQPDDRILEVGPGLGTLTRELAMRGGHVVAVEIDPLLVPIFRAETLAD